MTTSVCRIVGIASAVAVASARAEFPRDYCLLPADPGPCECYWSRYYYNATTGSCEPFIYGCCEGNENNFLTLAECEAACVPTYEDCLLPYDLGPCRGICPRFYYNAASEECEPFNFGCCHGNANNFLTKEACEATCPGDSSPGTAVPTVSEWGIVTTALLLLVTGAIVFGQPRPAPASLLPGGRAQRVRGAWGAEGKLRFDAGKKR